MGRYLLPYILVLLKIHFVFNYTHLSDWYVQICKVEGQSVPGSLTLQSKAFISHLVFVVGPEPDQSPF